MMWRGSCGGKPQEAGAREGRADRSNCATITGDIARLCVMCERPSPLSGDNVCHLAGGMCNREAPTVGFALRGCDTARGVTWFEQRGGIRGCETKRSMSTAGNCVVVLCDDGGTKRRR